MSFESRKEYSFIFHGISGIWIDLNSNKGNKVSRSRYQAVACAEKVAAWHRLICTNNCLVILYNRDWSRLVGSYVKNTPTICCLVGTSLELRSRNVPVPHNNSLGCCCRNPLPTVINPLSYLRLTTTKPPSSTSTALCEGNPHQYGPVMQKVFPYLEVTMQILQKKHNVRP